MPKTQNDIFQLSVLLQRAILKLEQLVERNNELLSRFATPPRSRIEPDLSLLTEEQQKVFKNIGAIIGKDVAARQKIESLLKKLAGQKVTEALALKAKAVLTERGWGVRCVCGEPAQLLWQRNNRCANGGLLGFSHSVDGVHKVHSSRTTFHDLDLVPKRDRRERIKI